MSGQRRLRLVEDKGVVAVEPRRVQGELWAPKGRQMHSLHYVVNFRGSSRPEVTDFCIRKYSKKGDVVLDPCCGRGTTLLQAALLGRVPMGSDSNPLAIKISRAKLQPVGLDEVVLRLNDFDFRRPVELSGYQEWFSPFYHPDTYRELLNLRAALQKKRDAVSAFIELLALSRLHGHTPAYFSIYSFPQLSLPPQAQRELNLKRYQEVEYRAVAPRLIRKAAEALRDGFTSEFHTFAEKSHVDVGDARRLTWIADDSVDLVVSALPSSSQRNLYRDSWLEFWFSGISRSEIPDSDVPEDMLSATLAEMLRVTRPDGHVILEFAEPDNAPGTATAEERVRAHVAELQLRGKRLVLEEVLVNQRSGGELAKIFRSEGRPKDIQHFLLVLRCIGKKPRKKLI